MAKFRVAALERFTVSTVYESVEAEDAEEAVARCRRGDEAYDSHRIEEGDEAWLQTVAAIPVEGDSGA